MAEGELSARTESRLAKKRIKKRLRDPLLCRFAINEIKRGKKTEVHRMEGEAGQNPVFFDVSSMREWATQNCRIMLVPVEYDRADRLVKDGAVDLDYVYNKVLHMEPEPIIVCRGAAGENGDQLVDGAHRYVAFCIASADLALKPPISAYVLEKEEWEQFILTASQASRLGFQ